MQSIKLSCLVIVMIFVTEVLSNQCPSERNTNIIQTIALNNTNSEAFLFLNMEYDSETDQYFYMIKSTSLYAYVLSRMDSFGNSIWSKAYNLTIPHSYDNYSPHYNTLQYSSKSQALYFVQSSDSTLNIVKISSIDGTFMRTYNITGSSHSSIHHSQCRLSNDELAYF